MLHGHKVHLWQLFAEHFKRCRNDIFSLFITSFESEVERFVHIRAIFHPPPFLIRLVNLYFTCTVIENANYAQIPKQCTVAWFMLPALSFAAKKGGHWTFAWVVRPLETKMSPLRLLYYLIKIIIRIIMPP